MPIPTHRTERMALADIDGCPENPRTITDRARSNLKASINRFGLVQSLVYNERTRQLVGGHQRIDQLRALGESEADVIVVDLDETEEKALSVALNSRHAQGEFSDGLDEWLTAI